MRPMFTFTLLALLLLVAAPFVFAEDSDPNLNLARVKWAIRQVEHWDGKSVGGSGELGPYQIRPAVWHQFSDKPLDWAYRSDPRCRGEQERVASELISWIDARLPGLRLPRTARSIGLVWTVGYGNVDAQRISRGKRAYAARVHNVYHDLTQQHPEEPAKSSSPVNPLFRP